MVVLGSVVVVVVAFLLVNVTAGRRIMDEDDDYALDSEGDEDRLRRGNKNEVKLKVNEE
jgi:hypothetical protein